MQVIIFNEEDGTRVMVPVLNIGLTIYEIAEKDVPTGVPYWIMDSDKLVVDDEGVVTVDTRGPCSGTGY